MKTLLENLNEFLRLLRTMQLADMVDIALVTFLVYQGIQLIRSSSTARIAKAGGASSSAVLGDGSAGDSRPEFSPGPGPGAGTDCSGGAVSTRAPPGGGEGGRRQFEGGCSAPGSGRRKSTTSFYKRCGLARPWPGRRWARLWCLERASRLDEYFKTGTLIDGRVSEQLIRNIFFPNASLHDGAMVIRDGRVAAAAVFCPFRRTTI